MGGWEREKEWGGDERWGVKTKEEGKNLEITPSTTTAFISLSKSILMYKTKELNVHVHCTLCMV